VKEVFENQTGNYTATGYAERMAKSFGEIYLGKDAGEQYLKEAAGANRAIQDVSRAEAFRSAHDHAEAVLQRMEIAEEEKTVEVKDFVDDLLADLCREWFGLPAEPHVAAGGWHWRDAGMPTCPGHFHSPSRYMFQPNPGKETSDAGQAHGRALNVAVRRWVTEHRHNGTVPDQALSARLFQAIPDDDERLTRTIIGVLMGFLPTVDGNLRATLYEWVNDRSLWDLQIKYCAEQARGLPAAQRVLLPALIRTMQLRPVPELTWRIALRKHDLGQVEVRAGETVVISIVSAMQECLADDDPDIYAVFGGARQRGGENLVPTHACPGYEMALGVLLGTLAALLDRTHLRPTLSPMALKMRLR
jgi:cytochrome P450